ncbi:LysR family transcriptional regulator [Pseudomonas sp. Fig-3]|uniref:LysR family transcriptional regulator n=1 Tax=unclassified Pseudomonas TaxID=196821 RepID=UPI001112B822|nr:MULTISPECIES: LysR family transcriptional regulator [unclassified Pseudomonas]TNB81527.1 LysR family transcriptional regulator [Pseudomonas sp. Fig-3]
MLPNNLTLKQMTIFVRVVESGGLTEAAQKINLTPSAVSKSLTLLEESLGLKLLQRTTRSLFLTDEGKIIYQRFSEIINSLESMLDSVSSARSEPKGLLRVSSPMALGVRHLMTIFSAYRERYPKINLQLDISDQPVNLNDGTCDVALRIARLPPENYTAKEISLIPWFFCASPHYLELAGTPKCIADLRMHTCLLYPDIDEVWHHYTEDGEKSLITYGEILIKANSSSVLLEAALKGMGVAYLPSYLMDAHVKKHELVPLFGNVTKNLSRKLFALHLPDRGNNPTISSFVNFLFEWASPVAPWDEWMEDYPRLLIH